MLPNQDKSIIIVVEPRVLLVAEPRVLLFALTRGHEPRVFTKAIVAKLRVKANHRTGKLQ